MYLSTFTTVIRPVCLLIWFLFSVPSRTPLTQVEVMDTGQGLAPFLAVRLHEVITAAAAAALSVEVREEAAPRAHAPTCPLEPPQFRLRTLHFCVLSTSSLSPSKMHTAILIKLSSFTSDSTVSLVCHKSLVTLVAVSREHGTNVVLSPVGVYRLSGSDQKAFWPYIYIFVCV